MNIDGGNKETAMKRTIAFIINTLRVGGAAKMMSYVAALTEEAGFSVYRISMFDDGKDDKNTINLGIKAKGAAWRIHAAEIIRSAVKEIHPDVVCAFVSDVAFTARLATLGLDCIFASAERGDPYTLNRKWKCLVKWAYRNSDYCFFQLAKARDFFGNRVKKKSYVIPNSIVPNTSSFSGIRNKRIVSAGRFVPEKDFASLIHAFKLVHDLHKDYTLCIYGDGPLQDAYNKLVSDLGIQDAVSFPGYSKNVSADICRDSVFVLSSKYEGMPNSLIEAMACGVPTVSTNCTPGGPAFLTKEGQRGLLVSVGDIKSMSEAICSIIENEELSETLSKRGLEVITELAPSVIDPLWINAFTEIVNQQMGK